MVYLVTGGAGFIGSNLAEALLSAGHKVRILDNFLTGKRKNIAGFTETFGGAFELIEGDLRELTTMRKAADGVEYILHQGALPSVPRSVADPALSNEINVGGTVNLLIAARDAGVRRGVFAASSPARSPRYTETVFRRATSRTSTTLWRRTFWPAMRPRRRAARFSTSPAGRESRSSTSPLQKIC